jgi:hypothetical protein
MAEEEQSGETKQEKQRSNKDMDEEEAAEEDEEEEEEEVVSKKTVAPVKPTASVQTSKKEAEQKKKRKQSAASNGKDEEEEHEDEDEEERGESPGEWYGWKKTIRRLVKYAPGQSMPKKKLIKRMKVICKHHDVEGAKTKYEFGSFKARVNEKLKKVKCVREDKNTLHYERQT